MNKIRLPQRHMKPTREVHGFPVKADWGKNYGKV